jgi:hypothetical protein
MVEQLTLNQRVVGSSPTRFTTSCPPRNGKFPSLPGFAHQQNRALFEDVMKALVIGASEHGIELVAELNGVRGGDVRIVCLLGFLDFHDHMMIEARDLLVDLDAHAALFLAAVGNVLLQQFFAGGHIRPQEVGVRHNVNPVARPRFLRERLPGKAAGD